MIAVTQSFIPPLEEYQAQVKRAFDNQWLTNRGELVLELEDKLNSYLGTDKVLVTNNGTIPIQMALKLLAKKGEVITTPFSYVATTAAIVWENLTPVFVDIHPEYLSIDEEKIEAAITENTTAILATHVFGNPCHVVAINKIAKKHNLAVIYDAAHCFGVQVNGESVFNFGEVSTCSFHATKLFHTGEGGAIFCKDETLFKELEYCHKFGHDGPLAFHGLGVNGKISELQAAMGLTVLPYMDKILSARKKVVEYYNSELDFKHLKGLKIREGVTWNYSYYPIIFDSEKQLLKTEKILNENQILPRRYFSPSLNKLPYVQYKAMPISESIAQRIMCLPLYVGLGIADLDRITRLINNSFK
ncbi:MAG: dTDP-4-amino-4,6-dideoxygalactose transaminase [Chitinophagales bacterium]|jgi:dTDP-4-amino-4,6-dideoxygalactose transaminase